MGRTRIQSLHAAIAVAAVLLYGLAGHGLPQMSSHEGMTGTAAGLCLLLATALACVVAPAPDTRLATVAMPEAPARGGSPPRTPMDGKARASPRALQRFRN